MQMSTISTRFAGLDLRSPVIVGSSSQTASVTRLTEYENAGAGAVVLKSLFEESITMEIAANDTDIHPEAYDYLAGYISEKVLSDYLDLIREAKKACTVPVIASIACHTDGKWEEFAARIEEAGADALELNIMSLCTARNYTPGAFEKMNEEIIAHVAGKIGIPVIAKIGSNLTNPVAMCDRLSAMGAKGVVLFNRFYPTDIDIDRMDFTTGNPFTSSADLTLPLRWAGIVSASVPGLPVAVSGGVDSWQGLVKSVLSGASAVEVASSVIRQGASWIAEANEGLEHWMEKKGFGTIEDFRGKLNASDPENADRLMRTQFIRHFSEVH